MKNKFLILIVIVIIILMGVLYFIFNRSPENPNSSQVLNTSPDNFDMQGIKVQILKRGDGKKAQAGNSVTVNYVGTLEDGTKFDSSIDRGTPFSFVLGQNSVIQGWELGVLGMQAGEKRKLTILSELGYGQSGAGGGRIPPNATLIFEIDMLSIN